PKYSASGVAEYHHHAILQSYDDLTLALIYVFVGDRDDITPTGTIANHEAYHRFDLAFTYSPGIGLRDLRDLQLVAKVQNMLDRHSSEAFGFPAPQVNFVAGVKLIF